MRTIVVKFGTGVLTTGIGQLNRQRLSDIAGEIARLRDEGTRVIIVSSAAIGLGMGRLGLKRKPNNVSKKQACAAIGQTLLMDYWQEAFASHKISVAQVLLTHDDLSHRSRHLGVKAALEEILEYGAIPVINENDVVSAAEIKLGDNDTLSAMVASLMLADHLIILSTAPGLIDLDGSKEIIPIVKKITPAIEALARGTKDPTATGGMTTKISAAKLATRAGTATVIASGAEPKVLHRILGGNNPGTYFLPSNLPLESRKHWLTFYQRPTATILIKDDAVCPLRDKGSSLLAIGVTGSKGTFDEGDTVNVATADGTLIARGISDYSSTDLLSIAGKTSAEVKKLFPNQKHHEVIHRNNLVIL